VIASRSGWGPPIAGSALRSPDKDLVPSTATDRLIICPRCGFSLTAGLTPSGRVDYRWRFAALGVCPELRGSSADPFDCASLNAAVERATSSGAVIRLYLEIALIAACTELSERDGIVLSWFGESLSPAIPSCTILAFGRHTMERQGMLVACRLERADFGLVARQELPAAGSQSAERGYALHQRRSHVWTRLTSGAVLTDEELARELVAWTYQAAEEQLLRRG
jgi:hypothetical protein